MQYEHRFGHYKAEPLAGLGQATFIVGTAAFLVVEAGRSLWVPRVVRSSVVGVGVMGISIALTLALVAYQRYVVRQTGSLAINADSLHYWEYVLVNLGAIIVLLLTTQLGWPLADPLFALIIAVYILRITWKIARLAH